MYPFLRWKRLRQKASHNNEEEQERSRPGDYRVNIAGGFAAAQLTSDYVDANGIRLVIDAPADAGREMLAVGGATNWRRKNS
jgi:hypothetical protein